MLTNSVQPTSIINLDNLDIQLDSVKATAIVPGFLDSMGFFKRESKSYAGTIIKYLNHDTLKNFNPEIVKNKRLVCLNVQDGVIKSICMHMDWVKQVEERKAYELVIQAEDNSSAKHVTSNPDLVPLNEKVYSEMEKFIGIRA